MARVTKGRPKIRLKINHISTDGGTFEGVTQKGYRFSASALLWIIKAAWDKGADFEDLADGYGEGLGTMGDWSGIRDSSEPAKRRMFERALNFLELGTD